MRPRRLRSADAQKGSTLRDAAGSCQEGERGSCRGAGAEAQERSTSLRSTASVGHREQQLHLMFLGRRTSGRLAASGCTCGSCSRCSGRRDGDWWKSCHSTSTSPTRREATRTRRSSLPPDVCTDAHARTHILHPTALVAQAASAASAAPIEPSTSAAQQPASPVRPLSACRCTRPVACAYARSTGLRPGYGCSPAMPNWLRMPAMLTALRRKTTRVTCR